MRKIKYRLTKRGREIFVGTFDECMANSPYKIERIEDNIPVYKASFSNGKSVKGTIDELCNTLNETKLNLYNYTRYKRKKDGLFLERIK